MFALVMVCSGLLAAPPPASPIAPEVLKQYESAKAKAGRDSGSQVRLALWCEARGLNAERTKHLALAVLSDPKNSTARGLLGLIANGNRWERPEAIADQRSADQPLTAKLAEYNAYRAQLEAHVRSDRFGVEESRKPGHRAWLDYYRRELNRKLAKAHTKLGLWCERNGLMPEALAHFTAAAEADPTRSIPWEHLGYRKHKGRWMSEAQIAAAIAETDAQRHADHDWERKLTRWKGWLATKARRAEAERQLAAVTDPRAVPSIWKVFGQANASDQRHAAELLRQVAGPLASRGLVMLAVFGETTETREIAARSMPERDPRDVVPPLIDTLQSRLTLKFRAKDPAIAERLGQILTADANLAKEPGAPYKGATFSEGELIVEGKRVNTARSFVGHGFGFISITDTPESIARKRRENAIEDDIARGEMIVEAKQAQAAIARFNAWVDSVNARAVPLLQTVTGQKLFDDSDEWRTWWADQRGYVYEPPDPSDKPTIRSEFQSPIIILPSPHGACFAAGTIVRTLSGPRPIEQIRVGDQVLAQNTKTGELTYRPVSAMVQNPPSTTLRVKIGAEPIVATPIHRFWKAGSGWVMARDLKPGDRVRSVNGVKAVVSIEQDEVRPVFNLEVVGAQNFFVGEAAALVHDHTPVEATSDPFDATPAIP